MESDQALIDAEVSTVQEAIREQHERSASTSRLRWSKSVEADNTPDETSPLLATAGSARRVNRHDKGDDDDDDDHNNVDSDDDDRNGTDGVQLWVGSRDLAHLPWYSRPSIFWLMGPFFIMACAFGGIIAPKLNLILQLICREYVQEQMSTRPGFYMAPVDFAGGDNSQCRIPEVQSRVAKFTLWTNLIAGLLTAITSPKLGALSDRYGRKVILITTSIGTILGELITMAAATYPETFPVNLLLLSFAFDGLTGSHIVAMSVSNAYATDCTPPNKRNTAFGYLHACLFTGIAVGPIFAGSIVKWSGNIAIAFYIMTAAHIGFMLFVLLFVPESLSRKRQLEAREKHQRERAILGDWTRSTPLGSLNFLEPLKVLWPTGAGSSPTLRRNLILLATVDTLMYGVAMGSMTILVIYTNYAFGWGSFEAGRFLTIVSLSRVFSLVVILPSLTRIFRGQPSPAEQAEHTGGRVSDLFTIRIAVLIDTLGCLGYTLARDGNLFTLSGVVASLGGLASPINQATLTKHIPLDRTGQIMGAIGLLHALARVFAPLLFNAIYSKTVDSYTQAVFLCLCITFGVASTLTWFVRPNVYFDEKASRLAEEDPDRSASDEEEEVGGGGDAVGSRIMNALSGAVTGVAALLGLWSAA